MIHSCWEEAVGLQPRALCCILVDACTLFSSAAALAADLQSTLLHLHLLEQAHAGTAWRRSTTLGLPFPTTVSESRPFKSVSASRQWQAVQFAGFIHTMSNKKHSAYGSHANPRGSSHAKVQSKMWSAGEQRWDFKNLFRLTGYVEHLARRCRKQTGHQNRDFRDTVGCGRDLLTSES